MSQDSVVITDGTGLEVLNAINAANQSLNTLWAGTAEPIQANQAVGMLWADTTNSLLKRLTVVGTPGTWTTLGKLTTNLGMLSLDGGTMVGDINMTSKSINEAKGADLASASYSTNAGSAMTGNFGDVTGTTTISALGTVQAGAERTIRFTGILTLTHNGTSLILPGAQDITTAAGDIAMFRSLGSGYWLLTNYTRGDGTLVELKASNLSAAATTDLGSAKGNYVVVTNTSGSTSVTSLGTAVPAGVRKIVTFSITGGSITINYNATSLIVPGSTNMSIADGDSATFMSLGSGNWRMVSYQPNTLSARIWTISAQTGTTYTITSGDYGKYFIWEATANAVITLPTIGTVGSGFIFALRNANTNNAKVTMNRASTDTIEGATSAEFGVGSGITYIADTSVSPNIWRRFESGITSVAGATYNTAIERLSSGTWEVPSQVYQARIRLWGGGGGGGGGASSASVTGGTGGNGAAGGTSSFGAIIAISANGGAGGTGGTSSSGQSGGAGGTGGTSTGGSTNMTGGSGGSGAASTSVVGGAGGGGGSSGGEWTVSTGGASGSTKTGGNGAANSGNLPSGGAPGGLAGYGGASPADTIGTGTASTYYQSGGGGGGGGGGGNGSSASNTGSGGGAGGAGGYTIGTFTVNPTDEHVITVGAGGGGGGGGGTNSIGTAGYAGSNASTTTGGQGGQDGSNSGGAGGGYNTGGSGIAVSAPGAGGGGANAGGGGKYGSGSSGGNASSSAGTSITDAAGTNGAGGGGGTSTRSGGGGAGAVPGGGGGGGGASAYDGATQYGGSGGGGGGDGRVIIEFNTPTTP